MVRKPKARKAKFQGGRWSARYTVWSGTTIGGYPVPTDYVEPPKCQHGTLQCGRSENWKFKHNLPITIHASDCEVHITCKSFWTNYIQYSPDRFLPPPIYCSNHRMSNCGLIVAYMSVPCISCQQDSFWTRCMLWRLLPVYNYILLIFISTWRHSYC